MEATGWKREVGGNRLGGDRLGGDRLEATVREKQQQQEGKKPPEGEK